MKHSFATGLSHGAKDRKDCPRSSCGWARGQTWATCGGAGGSTGAAASCSTPSCAAVLRELSSQHEPLPGQMGTLSISKPHFLKYFHQLFNYIFHWNEKRLFIANSDGRVRGEDCSQWEDTAPHTCSHMCPKQHQPSGLEHQTLHHLPPLPFCPSPPPASFVSASINSNSKKVATVLTVDTKRGRLGFQDKTHPFCARKLQLHDFIRSQREGERRYGKWMPQKSHVHSKDCRGDCGTENFISTLHPYLYVEKKKRSKAGKKVHFTLL